MGKRKRLAYFLDRFPDAPIELTPGKTYRIGRGSGNAVFVPDVGVSRSHAEIRWEGDSFAVEDLGSANGTFVNGAQVTTRALAPGDEIRVGTQTFGFRVEDASLIRRSHRRRRREMGELNTAVNYVPAEGGLAGAVADVPLAEIVQILDRARKTGRLYARFAGAHGSLSFRDGRVIAAEWTEPGSGESPDLEAACVILALADGVYEFVAEEIAGEPRIRGSTQALLLESMRRLDEGRLDEGQLDEGRLDEGRLDEGPADGAARAPGDQTQIL